MQGKHAEADAEAPVNPTDIKYPVVQVKHAPAAFEVQEAHLLFNVSKVVKHAVHALLGAVPPAVVKYPVAH